MSWLLNGGIGVLCAVVMLGFTFSGMAFEAERDRAAGLLFGVSMVALVILGSIALGI